MSNSYRLFTLARAAQVIFLFVTCAARFFMRKNLLAFLFIVGSAVAPLASLAVAQTSTQINPTQINFVARFSNPPMNPRLNTVYLFIDAASPGASTGGGSSLSWCAWNGVAFVSVGSVPIFTSTLPSPWPAGSFYPTDIRDSLNLITGGAPMPQVNMGPDAVGVLDVTLTIPNGAGAVGGMWPIVSAGDAVGGFAQTKDYRVGAVGGDFQGLCADPTNYGSTCWGNVSLVNNIGSAGGDIIFGHEIDVNNRSPIAGQIAGLWFAGSSNFQTNTVAATGGGDSVAVWIGQLGYPFDGHVTTNGFNVTWVDGRYFDYEWTTTKPLVAINGVVYEVSSVSNCSTTLGCSTMTLTGSAGVQSTPVTYTTGTDLAWKFGFKTQPGEVEVGIQLGPRYGASSTTFDGGTYPSFYTSSPSQPMYFVNNNAGLLQYTGLSASSL